VNTDCALPEGRCIAYVSSASLPMRMADLESILARSRVRNAADGVTGALVYNEGSFVQYIEGPQAGLEATWARIRNSSAHGQIIELLNEPVGSRSFANWHMGYTEATRQQLRALCEARWQSVRDAANLSAADSAEYIGAAGGADPGADRPASLVSPGLGLLLHLTGASQRRG
jgi:hypothetical protein